VKVNEIKLHLEGVYMITLYSVFIQFIGLKVLG